MAGGAGGAGGDPPPLVATSDAEENRRLAYVRRCQRHPALVTRPYLSPPMPLSILI